MQIFPYENMLVSEVFSLLLIFCRLGTMFMVMPGIGNGFISGRARLLLAIMVSLAMYPMVSPMITQNLGEVPETMGRLLSVLSWEILIGAFFGTIARIIISAMNSAGIIIAFQSGLAAAQMFDATQETQGSAFSAFLTLAATALMFASNIHHLMIIALVDSYTLFTPGAWIPVGDFSDTIVQIVSESFLIAVKFSAPLLVVGLLIYLGSGILARLMPTMQVFFVIIPAQILVGFIIIMLTISASMLSYMDYFRDVINRFIS